MKLFYVNVPKLVEERVALIAQDEADLQNILDKRAQSFLKEATGAKNKPERDKSGKIISFQLNKDWMY